MNIPKERVEYYGHIIHAHLGLSGSAVERLSGEIAQQEVSYAAERTEELSEQVKQLKLRISLDDKMLVQISDANKEIQRLQKELEVERELSKSESEEVTKLSDRVQRLREALREILTIGQGNTSAYIILNIAQAALDERGGGKNGE